jgi:hypothetical protein
MDDIMNDDATSARLTNIERKIDKITEILVSLAKLEESLQAQSNRQDLVDQRLNDQSRRLERLELAEAARSAVLMRLERLAWVLLTALIGLAAYWLRSLGA